MPGTSAADTVIGANGKLWVAPIGTAQPTLAAAALNAAFIDCGYVSEEGVTFHDAKGKISVPAWNQSNPIRKISTDEVTTVAFNLLQWNEPVFELAFGGTIAASGVDWKFTPNQNADPRIMCVEWADGAKHFRLLVPRGEVSGEIELVLTRTNVVPIPVSFESTPAVGELPYYFLTDDDVGFTGAL
jgi:hypothetical protein